MRAAPLPRLTSTGHWQGIGRALAAHRPPHRAGGRHAAPTWSRQRSHRRWPAQTLRVW